MHAMFTSMKKYLPGALADSELSRPLRTSCSFFCTWGIPLEDNIGQTRSDRSKQQNLLPFQKGSWMNENAPSGSKSKNLSSPLTRQIYGWLLALAKHLLGSRLASVLVLVQSWLLSTLTGNSHWLSHCTLVLAHSRLSSARTGFRIAHLFLNTLGPASTHTGFGIAHAQLSSTRLAPASVLGISLEGL
ncbi:hypothetical protein JB92DRAFT_2825492 [Gautieria morchelliformis]|nr:hypothetical protein JB92DRAFT_2825492 [Gautieria morchelliformis]